MPITTALASVDVDLDLFALLPQPIEEDAEDAEHDPGRRGEDRQQDWIPQPVAHGVDHPLAETVEHFREELAPLFAERRHRPGSSGDASGRVSR